MLGFSRASANVGDLDIVRERKSESEHGSGFRG